MNTFNKIFYIIKNISLQVVLGAVFSGLFISVYLNNVVLDIYLSIGLGLSVWAIYTFDHLIDALKSRSPSGNPRHYFHQKYFWPLFIAFETAVLAVLVLCYFMPLQSVYYGILMIPAIGLYFIVIRSKTLGRVMPKEILAALLFTAGVFLPAFSIIDQPPPAWFYLVFSQFFCLTLINLLEFGLFEYKMDKKTKQLSFPILFNKKMTRLLIGGFMIFIWLTGIYLIVFWKSYSFMVWGQSTILVMSLILGLIYWKAKWFKKNMLYQYIGDGVFIIPGIVLLIKKLVEI